MTSQGYVLLSRELFEAILEDCTPCTRLVYLYFLYKANYKGYRSLKRGELVTNKNEIRNDLGWLVGCYTKSFTDKQIESAIKKLKDLGLIRTIKIARGIKVIVLNYEETQNADSYLQPNEKSGPAEPKRKSRKMKKEGPLERTMEGTNEGSDMVQPTKVSSTGQTGSSPPPEGHNEGSHEGQTKVAAKNKEGNKANNELYIRKKKFLSKVMDFKGQYTVSHLNGFYEYWSEEDHEQSKMKWEREPTWSFEYRLKLWKDYNHAPGLHQPQTLNGIPQESSFNA